MRINSDGHTIVELLIAMAVAAILITAIFQIYELRQNSHYKQQLAVEMQQNIRAAVSLIKREIRMAGYDPAANDGVDSDGDSVADNDEESAGTGIHTAGRHIIQFTFDNDGDMEISPDERISYGFANMYDGDKDGVADGGAAPFGRQVGAGTLTGVAENIQAYAFAYAFDNNHDGNLDTDDGTADGNIIWAFDSDISDGNNQLTANLETGLPLAVPVPLSDIRAVRIWILARTRAPVRGHFDSRTYTVGDRIVSSADTYQRRLIRTTVYCRNMSL
ncbi:MAG: PilW family protein [Desulfobacterales bacterium]|nr:MAG: PilW family protein [Desulfobacterales bacterium]